MTGDEVDGKFPTSRLGFFDAERPFYYFGFPVPSDYLPDGRDSVGFFPSSNPIGVVVSAPCFAHPFEEALCSAL
jgi:hypothetical protein